jgi:HK97 gp10 family phage protein
MASKFKFTNNTKQVFANINQDLVVGMTKASMLVQAQAKMLAPVGKFGTGELRDKIDYNITNNNGEIIGQVGSPAMYAPYIEFGTGEFAENDMGRKGGWAYKSPDGKWHFTYGMSPRPFLRPAFRANKDAIQKILSAFIRYK